MLSRSNRKEKMSLSGITIGLCADSVGMVGVYFGVAVDVSHYYTCFRGYFRESKRRWWERWSLSKMDEEC